jgi:uncharacterized HAD superfamily protein
MKIKKEHIREMTEILKSIFDCGVKMNIGIDLDGTITDAPEFFRALTSKWDGKVYIITYRDNKEIAENDVKKFGVKFDEVILVNSFKEKADVIREKNIKFFFDDMDEVIMHIPEDVMVFKVRNGGNFCSDSSKWLYSKNTGKLI